MSFRDETFPQLVTVCSCAAADAGLSCQCCLGALSHTQALPRFLYFGQQCDFSSEIIRPRQSQLQMGSDSHLEASHTQPISARNS